MTRDEVINYLEYSKADYKILSDNTVLQTIKVFRDEEQEEIINHWGYQGNWNFPMCLSHSNAACGFV